MNNRSSCLTGFIAACLLSAFPLSSHALFIVGGAAEGGLSSPAQGIGIGNDGKPYVFITPRHFLVGHSGPPISFPPNPPANINGIQIAGGATTVRLSSLLSQSQNRGLYIAELVSDLPGVTPLPVGYSDILGDWLDLTLLVHGQSPAYPDYIYGFQNSGSNPDFTLINDAGVGMPPPTSFNFPIVDLGPEDALLYVDVRGTGNINGRAFLQGGDSNSALLADLGGGQIVAIGTALGFFDAEAPLLGFSTEQDVNFYNIAGFYQQEIETYLEARSAALGQTFQAQFVPLNNVIPEPSRALTLAFGALLLLHRRRR